MKKVLAILTASILAAHFAGAQPLNNTRVDGYRGIWLSIFPSPYILRRRTRHFLSMAERPIKGTGTCYAWLAASIIKPAFCRSPR